jgi:ABC-type glycerol-3-phosphate transport system permease component
VDASLRREAALEGVYQWTFHKLMSPLVAAEILVSTSLFCFVGTWGSVILLAGHTQFHLGEFNCREPEALPHQYNTSHAQYQEVPSTWTKKCKGG